MGCPIPLMKPRRQRSTPRRPTLGALNLTESRRARPCAICRREPGHAGGSAQHLAPPVAVDAEGENRRRPKTLASGSFSTRTRRLIISSVIGGSSVALVDSQPDPTDEPPVTTPSCSLTTALRRARFVSGLLPSSYTITEHGPANWKRVPEHRFVACLKRIQSRDVLVGRGSQVVHVAEEILAGLREPGYS